jgi:hypothetical protein
MVALIGVHLRVDCRPRGGAGGSRQPGGGDNPGSGDRGLDEFAAMHVLRHRYPPSIESGGGGRSKQQAAPGAEKHADMPASGENGGSIFGYLIDGRVNGVSLRPPQRFATVH